MIFLLKKEYFGWFWWVGGGHDPHDPHDPPLRYIHTRLCMKNIHVVEN